MMPMQLLAMIFIILDLLPRAPRAIYLITFIMPMAILRCSRRTVTIATTVVVVIARHLVSDLFVVVRRVQDFEYVLHVPVLRREFLVVSAKPVPELEWELDMASFLPEFADAIRFSALHVGVAGPDREGEGALFVIRDIFEPEGCKRRGLVERQANVFTKFDDEAGAVAFAHCDADFAVFFAGPGAVAVGGHFTFADCCAELEA